MAHAILDPKGSRPSPVTLKQQETATARFIGAGTAGIAEVILFHPVDTIAKRLMSNTSQVVSASQLNAIIFKSYSNEPFGRRFTTLFPGLGYAAAFKILQRVHKYGGQPFVCDYLSKHHKIRFDQTFGRNSRAIMNATAGSLIGVSEVVLLPLDVLKIKRQTNPQAFNSRNVYRIVRDEGFGLYRGWAWTVARNAPGSFALFGGSAATKQYLFALQDYHSPTAFQNFIAAVAGSSASIVVSAPLDVVKTRIQSKSFGVKESGLRIVSDMIRREGLGGFFKGLTPKLLITGPKITFSFWLAQTLIPMLNKAQ